MDYTFFMNVYTVLNYVGAPSIRGIIRCLSEQEHLSEQLYYTHSTLDQFASRMDKSSTSNNFSCVILTNAHARSIMQASECKRSLDLNHS